MFGDVISLTVPDLPAYSIFTTRGRFDQPLATIAKISHAKRIILNSDLTHRFLQHDDLMKTEADAIA